MTAWPCPFEPRTGVRLVAHGRVDVFEAQGAYQLYVDSLQPAGCRRPGAAVRGAQGAADRGGPVRSSRKRPLPAWPRTIGVVHLSLSGAVLHDIARCSRDAGRCVRVIVSACQVQGPGAPESRSCARAAPHRPLDGRRDRPCRRPRHRGARRRLARGPVGLQRGSRGARHRRPPGAHHRGRRPRDRCDPGRVRRRRRAATPSVAAELAVPDRAEQAQHLRTLRWPPGQCRRPAVSAARGPSWTPSDARSRRSGRRVPRCGARTHRPAPGPGHACRERPAWGRRQPCWQRSGDRLPMSSAAGLAAARTRTVAERCQPGGPESLRHARPRLRHRARAGWSRASSTPPRGRRRRRASMCASRRARWTCRVERVRDSGVT